MNTVVARGRRDMASGVPSPTSLRQGYGGPPIRLRPRGSDESAEALRRRELERGRTVGAGSRTSPESAARSVKHRLARLARPAGSFDASRYFRGAAALGFYNIRTDRVRDLAKAVVREHPAWGVDDAMRFADALMSDRFLEVKTAAIEVVARYRKAFSPGLLRAWKRWLRRGYSANWATTDSVCASLIGPLLVAHPRLVPRVAAWSRDRNLWVRRASAVSLIPLVRRGDALETAYSVARTLHRDPADLIQKAVGWMLREAGKADPVRLERYLRENGPRIPRTTVRYAIERFAPAKRRLLLKLTRSRERSRVLSNQRR
jgi:3-methyladenine DNA glycosylase AlkD